MIIKFTDHKYAQAHMEPIHGGLALYSYDTRVAEVIDGWLRINGLYSMADSILAEDKLTEEIMKNLIKMVYVYDKNHIEVEFAFTDLILEVLENRVMKNNDML